MLFKLRVDLGGDAPGVVEVREGDDLEELARNFVAKYQLPNEEETARKVLVLI